MFQLKKLSLDALPRAIGKAEHYRLLNDPRAAESICLDVLAADETNQRALVILLLSTTDLFGEEGRATPETARALLPRIGDDYVRSYYAGMICERWGKHLMAEKVPGHVSHGWIHEAMTHYQLASHMSPAGNDDALLRWNTCARLLNQHGDLKPRAEEIGEMGEDGDVPRR